MREFEPSKALEYFNHLLMLSVRHMPFLNCGQVRFAFEKVGINHFNDLMIGAVASLDGTITVNIDWFCSTSEQDVMYIIWHEIRHVYQMQQIQFQKKNSYAAERTEDVLRWKTEFEHYVTNTPATTTLHYAQEIEQDAYAFALSMLFRYCANDDGSVDIGLPPIAEQAIYKRALELYNTDPISNKAVGRNDLCPCGSGVKFKNCHGRKSYSPIDICVNLNMSSKP